MNPDAIEWLENLSDDGRHDRFTPVGSNEGLAQLKSDHEVYRGECRFCGPARRSGSLVVIG